MNIVFRKTDSIIPYEKNPRFNDDAVDAVCRSIEQFGFRVPILLDQDSVIIAGHTRLKAALRLNLPEVPCIVAENLTPVQVKEYRIADNKLGEIASWDYEKLEFEFNALQDSGLDLDFLDFSIVDLSAPIDYGEKEGKTASDSVPKEEVEPVSETGKIYQLGEHLLLCGDALQKNNYPLLMNGGFAKAVILDLPALDTDADDRITEDQAGNLLDFTDGVLDENGSVYLFYQPSDSVKVELKWNLLGWKIFSRMHWVKRKFDGDKNHYHLRAEPVQFLCKGSEMQWNGNQQQTNVLRYDRPKKNPAAPGQKPVDLISRLLQNSTSPHDIVFDPLGGSGSTLISCEKNDRRCRMIELNPKRCDIIRRRWAEFVFGEDCDWEQETPEIAR